MRVLLLSRNFEPISVVNWRKAMRMLFLEKAEVIEESDLKIKSANMEHNIPSIMRLLIPFKKKKSIIKFSKNNLFARDNYRCQYCGKKGDHKGLTYDHVVPKSRGGKTTWENIVTACSDCNGLKANKTPEEAGMTIKTKPTKPNWIPLFSVALGRQNIPTSWRQFCYY